MTISIIVAAAENGVIGNKGELAWRLPAELAHFKQLTIGHPIIMGRKTYESIGRALPRRTNIVITHDPNYSAPGCTVVTSLDAALAVVPSDTEEVFIIGGATIYKTALPLANKLYLTKVHAAPDGDTFFMYNPTEWRTTAQEDHPADDKNQLPFTFLELEHVDL
jgi:dihydrofolate reductase